ncbi:hypothetical protein LTR84_009086 [Exophiala bonariae]|uniref:Uncharacterized protein n=1 Tax=Exophiala bonariae TaxID=1690606 RepID=A0AAV9MVK0_9EURO|nr:hypothetical protein LTR84_009086 [Exophiala bonariae]
MAPALKPGQSSLSMQLGGQLLHRMSKSTTRIHHASNSSYAPSNFTRQFPSQNYQDAGSSFASRGPPPPSHTLPGPNPLYAYPRARSIPTELPGTKLTFTTWFKSLFGWKPKAVYKPAPIHIATNPYRARKQWPPDFRDLDFKKQFHFEKTYRRRAALKWARPTWNKSIKILQQTLITFTLVYFIFICEPAHGEGTPFDGFRVWFFGKIGTLTQLPDATKQEAEKLTAEALQKMKKPIGTSDDASPVNT